MLVAQHNLPVDVKDGNAIRTAPAGLSVFRIVMASSLTCADDIDAADKTMFWMGMA